MGSKSTPINQLPSAQVQTQTQTQTQTGRFQSDDSGGIQPRYEQDFTQYARGFEDDATVRDVVSDLNTSLPPHEVRSVQAPQAHQAPQAPQAPQASQSVQAIQAIQAIQQQQQYRQVVPAVDQGSIAGPARSGRGRSSASSWTMSPWIPRLNGHTLWISALAAFFFIIITLLPVETVVVSLYPSWWKMGLGHPYYVAILARAILIAIAMAVFKDM